MTVNDPKSPRRHFWGIRPRLLIGFVAVGLAIGLLAWRGAKQDMVYYVTVSELLTGKKAGDREGLRVTGQVVSGTIERDDMTLRFQMTDGARTVPVSYRGVIPDTFGEKGEVVVEGVYRANGTFDASFLMAKCPSKYEMSPDETPPANMPAPASKASTS